MGCEECEEVFQEKGMLRCNSCIRELIGNQHKDVLTKEDVSLTLNILSTFSRSMRDKTKIEEQLGMSEGDALEFADQINKVVDKLVLEFDRLRGK